MIGSSNKLNSSLWVIKWVYRHQICKSWLWYYLIQWVTSSEGTTAISLGCKWYIIAWAQVNWVIRHLCCLLLLHRAFALTHTYRLWCSFLLTNSSEWTNSELVYWFLSLICWCKPKRDGFALQPSFGIVLKNASGIALKNALRSIAVSIKHSYSPFMLKNGLIYD